MAAGTLGLAVYVKTLAATDDPGSTFEYSCIEVLKAACACPTVASAITVRCDLATFRVLMPNEAR